MNNKKIEEKAINLVIENLENILNNPANAFLPINVKDIIETSTRLLKVESDTLTQYKEALRLLVVDCQILLNRSNRLDKDLFSLNQAKQLLKE